jgi:hypothetical protein
MLVRRRFKAGSSTGMLTHCNLRTVNAKKIGTPHRRTVRLDKRRKRMITRALVSAAAIVLAATLVTIAQPPQSPQAMRARADQLAQQAMELRAQGNHEEAKKLAREAEDLLKAAALAERGEQRKIPPEQREAMMAELDRLRADRARLIEQGMRNAVEPINQRIADLEKQLGIEPPPEPKPHDAPPEEKPRPQALPSEDQPRPEFKPIPHLASPQEIEAIERRIHHLRIVADNLRAAGLPDRAAEYEKELVDLERERDRMIAPEPIGENERIHVLEMQMDDLHNEIRELRDELRRLSEEVKRLTAER